MNWKRIILFAYLFLAAATVGAFPFIFFAGFLEAKGQPLPFWIGPVASLFTILGPAFVIVILVGRQREKVAIHAWLAGAMSLIIGIIIDIAFSKIRISRIPLASVHTAIAICIGLFIGKRRYQKLKEL